MRGANLYRQQKEDAAALAQLDYVLKVNPTNAAAVVTRSFIHMNAKQYDEAAGMLRRAIEMVEQEGRPGDQEADITPGRLLPDAGSRRERDASRRTHRPGAPGRCSSRGSRCSPSRSSWSRPNIYSSPPRVIPRLGSPFWSRRPRTTPRAHSAACWWTCSGNSDVYDKAEEHLRQLIQESPDDVNLAAALVQVDLAGSRRGRRLGATRIASDRLTTRRLSMIADYRKRYPDSVVFLQTECDLVARGGNVNRAIAISEEIDKLAPTSHDWPAPPRPPVRPPEQDSRGGQGLR